MWLNPTLNRIPVLIFICAQLDDEQSHDEEEIDLRDGSDDERLIRSRHSTGTKKASGSRSTSASDKGKGSGKSSRGREGRAISVREQQEAADVFAEQADTAQRVLGLLETVAQPRKAPPRAAAAAPPPPPLAEEPTPQETFAAYLRSVALNMHPGVCDDFRDEVSHQHQKQN